MSEIASDADDAELYGRVAPELIRFATALVGRVDAPDVLSGAVVKALATPGWPAVVNRRAYLYRSVFNEAQTWLRRAGQRPILEARAARAAAVDRWELPTLRPDVRVAVAGLSVRQRAVIVLTYWADLDPRSVAEWLGISEGSVRRHLARARARLREVSMPDSVASDPLDVELRGIAEALVAEAPEAPGLPYCEIDSVVTRRGLARRRRPLAAVAAAAAVVLILVAGALAVTRGNDGGDPDDAVLATDAGLEPAPQRLILDDWRRELPLDGDPVGLELAGLDPHGAPRPLPDGGHVVVGIHPVEEPPPEGFNEFTDLTYGLAAVGADGEVDVERDIEASTLVGVTATEAILARQPRDESGEPSGPASTVTHDLATGEERVVHQDVTFDPDRMVSARSAVVAGELVTVEASQLTEPTDENASVFVPGSEECTLRVTDLASGKEAEQPLDVECSMVRGLQASPDGSRAAIAYEGSRSSRSLDDTPEVRLAVIDLPDGAVDHDQLLGHNVDCRAGGCPPDARPVDYQGMAWDDASSVRVAMVDLAASFGDLVVETIPVG